MNDNALAGAEYVGFFARLIASIIDTIAIVIVLAPLGFIGVSTGLLSMPAVDGTGAESMGFLGALVQWVVFPAIVILFWRYRGATPGKMVIGAVIVDAETGDLPTVKQSIGRYLGYILSSIPLGLGFLWVIFDDRKQAWHDKLAGTVVIRGRRA
jgi:uncharacterized RDD family membrane protein YckC